MIGEIILKKLKVLLKLAFFLLFVSILIFITVENLSTDSEVSSETSILEAYQIGIEMATKYDSKAQLIFINSVDDELHSGSNGKKANWNSMYTLPTQEKRILIIIRSGVIEEYKILEKIPPIEVIAKGEIMIDSIQGVGRAIDEYALEPANIDGFMHGYHFKLLKDNNITFFTVVGFDKNEVVTEIHYNAKTGEYLGETRNN